MLAGVIHLFKKIFRPIFKVASLFVITILLIVWIALFTSGHFALPYIPMIAPDPSFTGYVGFYSLMISAGLIPIIWFSIFLFRRIWGWKQTARYRTPLYGAWIVSFFIFVFTFFFTARNFKETHSWTETMQGYSIEKSTPLVIRSNNYPSDSYSDNIHLEFGPVRLTDDHLYLQESGMLDLLPTDQEEGYVKKSVRSSGLNKAGALKNARYVKHNLELKDNHLSYDNFYSLAKSEKFRLQQVRYQVYIPVGTKIQFENQGTYRQKRYKNRFGYNKESQNYIMTKNGLETLETESI